HIADIKDLCGHKGGAFENSIAVYDAIKSGAYDGEWFMPTAYILDKKLCDSKDRGDLAGTFAALSDDFYWSCTEAPDNPHYVCVQLLSSGAYIFEKKGPVGFFPPN